MIMQLSYYKTQLKNLPQSKRMFFGVLDSSVNHLQLSIITANTARGTTIHYLFSLL